MERRARQRVSRAGKRNVFDGLVNLTSYADFRAPRGSPEPVCQCHSINSTVRNVLTATDQCLLRKLPVYCVNLYNGQESRRLPKTPAGGINEQKQILFVFFFIVASKPGHKL